MTTASTTAKVIKEFAAMGGRAGKGEAKRRSKAHYARITQMAAKKRIADAKARKKLLAKPLPVTADDLF